MSSSVLVKRDSDELRTERMLEVIKRYDADVVDFLMTWQQIWKLICDRSFGWISSG